MSVTLAEGGVTSRGDMLLTTTTLFSQTAEPSPLWEWFSRNTTVDAESHGFPASATKRQCEAAPCVSPGGKAEMRTVRSQPQKLKTSQAFSTPSFQPCS